MTVKILVTGDIHLGRRSGSIDRSSDYGSTSFIWERIVNRAITMQVDAVAVTGDVVDRDNRFFEAIGPLQRGFEKLADADIRVVIIAGNHDFDVLPELLDSGVYPNVCFLGRGQTWEKRTLDLKGQRVTFAGWSYASRHVNEDPLDAFDLEFNGPETPVIGMIHGDVDIPQSSYAPMSRAGFYNKGVDVWLLGHIHKHSVLLEHPLVLYPGSPQALDAGEKGQHGPVLLTIDHKNSIEYDFLSWSPVQYEDLVMDVTGIGPDELRGELNRHLRIHAETLRLEDQDELLYDVDLTGEYDDIRILEEKLRPAADMVISVAECQVGIRKINTSRLQVKIRNLEELAHQKSPVGMIAEVMIAIKEKRENEFLEDLRANLNEVYRETGRREIYSEIKVAHQEEKDDFLDEVLWQQCNQLLSELMRQQENV